MLNGAGDALSVLFLVALGDVAAPNGNTFIHEAREGQEGANEGVSLSLATGVLGKPFLVRCKLRIRGEGELETHTMVLQPLT